MPDSKTNLTMRVLRDLLRRQRFETIADLADVLKRELARLHIRTTAADVDLALEIVKSNTVLVRPPRQLPPDRLHSLPPLFTHAEATHVLEQLRRRLRHGVGPRAIR